ncbi:MAG: HAD family hydrolase [Acidobacteria bacterium]|nr:HAD family hydrolase [Acidobacteriota bacterium]
MKLVIFDIDGTLTNTSQVDSICFERALAQASGLMSSEADWSDCPHVSDTGLTRHLYQNHFGREPHDHEEVSLRDCLVDLLNEHHAQDDSWFAEIDGAAKMLIHLSEKAHWQIAVATGCWRASAEMKLKAAQLAVHQKPGGFAEDGPSRESIVTTAIQRASNHYGRINFDRIVSVGDGVWDVKTAANLEIAFVGVAQNSRAELLQKHGARHVVPDFKDISRFFACLDDAVIPTQSRSTAV